MYGLSKLLLAIPRLFHIPIGVVRLGDLVAHARRDGLAPLPRPEFHLRD